MKPGAAVIAGICTYETVAILSGEAVVPTITRLWRARPMPVRALLLAGACGWLTHHILIDPGD